VNGGSETGPDFFVSYTQADRAWAEWIAWTLEKAGHSVLIQAWDFTPGSDWAAQMIDGMARAARTGRGALRRLHPLGIRDGRVVGGPAAGPGRVGTPGAGGRMMPGVAG
jgi:hypothetical protein